ncbi:MAG: ribonuclease HI [Clostridia bacterium]|nr:ribonuclease HI [Clostridia bacterium]
MIVEMFTDGACSGNPGPGGWCCILRYGQYEKMLSGGAAQTTNNRMELTAVIEGLRALNRPCEVLITTDSKYVADSVTKHWLDNWAKKNWVKSGKPVPNTDLWQQLLAVMAQHKLTFHWVRGHNGHPENERCDKEAVRQSEIYKNA